MPTDCRRRCRGETYVHVGSYHILARGSFLYEVVGWKDEDAHDLLIILLEKMTGGPT